MAKITIAQLDLDTNALLKKAEEVKKEISELNKEQKKLKESSKENTTEFINNEVQLKKNKKALLAQKNAIIALETPYAKLSKQLQVSRNEAKDLAAEFGVNSEQARKASENVRKLDTTLKEIDDSVGQNQRSVGKYSDAVKDLEIKTSNSKNEFEKLTLKQKENSAEIKKNTKLVKDLTLKHGETSREVKEASRNLKELTSNQKRNDDEVKKAKISYTQYNTQLNQANIKLKQVNRSTVNNSKVINNHTKVVSGITSRFLGWSAVIFGVVRAFRDMIRRIVAFDKEMTGLAAIIGVSRKEVKDLEKEIVKVAGSSKKTSNEVAELATSLITLGKTKTEVIQLLKPVNDLSIGLKATSAEAGELLVQTLNAFGKGTESAEEYAGIIAKMRTSTSLDFQKIKDSLGFLAPTASVADISLERTGAILGILANSSIKASRAGRLTSTAFLRLAADGETLEDALDDINKAQDRGVSNTELLAIAGKKLGVEFAPLGLILANNREKTDELTKSLEDNKGVLEDLVKRQYKSFDAALKSLDSSWEKLILNIENGEGAIAKFSKSIILATSNFVSSISDVSELSTGFLDFGMLMAKSLTQSGRASLKLAVDGKQAIETMNNSRKRLIKLTTEQSAIDKEYKTQLDFRIAAIEKLSKKEIDAALKVFEAKDLLAKKEIEDEKKKAADLIKINKELTDEEIDRQTKDRNTLNKKIKDLNRAFEISEASDEDSAKKIKLNQKLKDDKAEIQALAISKKEKNSFIKELDRKHQQEVQEIDLANIQNSEERKRDLLNEIELNNAKTEEEKEIIKAEQDFEKEQQELEKLTLTSEEKTELLALLTTQEEQVKSDIRKSFSDKELELFEESNKKIIAGEKKQASERQKIAKILTGSLNKLLGDSLGARLSSIAIQAGVEAGLVKINAASASGQVTANTAVAVSKSIAASPLTGGLPFSGAAIAAGGIQQGLIAGSSASAISRILGGAAIKGLGSLASFDKGGKVANVGNGKITNDTNIPTRQGGDNILATVKKGEVILNESQQQRAGGSAFFSSIGVPGFANGGAFGSVNSTVTAPIQQVNSDVSNLANKIVQGINNIKVVTVVDDVTNAQAIQSSIVSGADI